MSKLIAILTPTYNRAKLLPDLYLSLTKQTCFDFKWYIIDDGSTDNTQEVVKSFSNEKFEIYYCSKENGGKHTACNVGFSLIDEELTFIVDSDDMLTPDAVEHIAKDWQKYKGIDNIAGLSYHKLTKSGEIVGNAYVGGDVVVSSYIDMRINNHVSGDSAEIFKTKILNALRFPEIDGEKFLSEAILWNEIANRGYNLVYIQKGIYYCEYLPGGLTSQGRIKQLQNPKGTMLHAKSYLSKGIKLSIRAKYMLMYIALVRFAGATYKKAFLECGNKRLFIMEFLPAMFLKLKWRKLIK